MKAKNSGFTLIELVVVIVILGILASQAVPRFSNLTTQANQAVAEGGVGAFLSQAVILLGQNSGASSTSNTIITTMDLSGDLTTGSFSIDCTGGGPYTLTVTVGGETATGSVSDSLCSGN